MNLLNPYNDYLRRAGGREHPDYRNTLTTVTVQNDVVVMIGYSTCSYKRLNGPNIWTAKIRDRCISEWRVIWLDQR